MQSVSEIASAIIAREGGYANDPDDPGGATKYGVTLHTLRRLGLDLTGDGRIGVADVRKLTRPQAVESTTGGARGSPNCPTCCNRRFSTCMSTPGQMR